MKSFLEGFRFSPTDEELIVNFLEKKLKGEPVPNDAGIIKFLQKKSKVELFPKDLVLECDIYDDKEPWKIFDKNVKQIYYVFTKLKRKSKSKIERTAGSGTWRGEQPAKPIHNDENRCIGYKKLFTFKVPSSSKTEEANGHWIMHEFSIRESDDYVLCKIRNKETDKLKTKPAEFEHQQDAPIHNIATNQGYDVQSFGSTYLTVEEGNQQHDMMQCDSNIVAAKQCNESNLVGVPMESSSVDSIFDGLPGIDPTMSLTNNGEYLDNSMREFILDSPDAFDATPIHNIATNQGYTVQSFDPTYLIMKEGNQQQDMIQCGSNIVAAKQCNESNLLGVPMESSSVDSIFDGLPGIDPTISLTDFETLPYITNVEDINIGDYLDNSMPELIFDDLDAFGATPIHNIATNQGYNVQSFGSTYLSMEEGNQQGDMIQCGSNIVAAKQCNESNLLGVSMDSSSVDSIFDGLVLGINPTVSLTNFETVPYITNVGDINIGDYLDNSMPKFIFDSPGCL